MRSVLMIFLPALLALAFLISCKTVHRPAGSSGDAFLWKDIPAQEIPVMGYQAPLPAQYRSLVMNTAKMRTILQKTHTQTENSGHKPSAVIELPLPEGGYGSYTITEQVTMAPALLEKYPQLRTYGGQGITEPTSTVKLDFMPGGFHAYLSTQNGAVIIEPYSMGDTLHYLCFYKHLSTREKEVFEIPADSIKEEK